MLSWKVPPCLSLPHSVQTLEVHLETFLHNYLNNAVVRLHEASPTLKDLHVTYDPNIDTVPEGFFQSLPDFCIRRNIRFRLMRGTDWPLYPVLTRETSVIILLVAWFRNVVFILQHINEQLVESTSIFSRTCSSSNRKSGGI